MTASTPLGYLRGLLAQTAEDLTAQLSSDTSARELLLAKFDLLHEERRPVSRESWLDVRVRLSAASWLIAALIIRQSEHRRLLPQTHSHSSSRDWLMRRFAEVADSAPGIGLFQQDTDPLFDIPVSDRLADVLFDIANDHDAALTGFGLEAGPSVLGDIYQEVLGPTDPHYALVQTPTFVVEHILDLALRPVLADDRASELKIMDPACGSGEFLVRAFEGILSATRERSPDIPLPQAVQQALAALHGMDIHPAATSITRFRLLTAALDATGENTLGDAGKHGWSIRVRTGDSLLELAGEEGVYDVVIGNPPYVITRAGHVDRIYRDLFSAAQGRFPLTVPFIQLFIRLARRGDADTAGHVGLLCANSFGKRQFGRNLIEEFLPREATITHVIDTAGAFIPGHGTPTVILAARHRTSTPDDRVFVLLGRRGEPRPPMNPARGLVWRSIVRGIANGDHRDEWTVSTMMSHDRVTTFPWAFAEGDTATVLDQLNFAPRLASLNPRIGYDAAIGSEEIFTGTREVFDRERAELGALVPIVSGEHVRDWLAESDRFAFHGDPAAHPGHLRRLWPYRTVLGHRKWFAGKTYSEAGTPWYSWHQRPAPRDAGWRIAYAALGTGTHFALLPAGTVALPSAPVIQSIDEISAPDLTAYLNTSTVCFWLKQFSPEKGQPNAHQTVGEGEPWEARYQFTPTQIRDLPVPAGYSAPFSSELAGLATEINRHTPRVVLATRGFDRDAFDSARHRWTEIRYQMIALAEEIDWQTYAAFGLCDASLLVPGSIPPVRPGERAFEIVLARKIASGEVSSRWFERHHTTPLTEVPSHWPEQYRDVVAERVRAIQLDSRVAVLERAANKRRWLTTGWDGMARKALEQWILNQCESMVHTASVRPRLWRISDIVAAAETRRPIVEASGHLDPDRAPAEVIHDLVLDSQVPVLAALRYRTTALPKWRAWRAMWTAQTQEDVTGTPSPEVSSPPRYTNLDFLKPSYWRHRGKFDVPSEVFFSSPTPAGLMVGCARWTPAARAQALSTALAVPSPSGLDMDLMALLAGLQETMSQERIPPAAREEIIPSRLAAFDAWKRNLGLTDEDLQAWIPEPPRRGRPRKRP